MAILALFNAVGMTPEMYQSLRRDVAWTSQLPDGGIFHAAATDEAGHIRVADVWESAEAMQSFVETRLVPVMQKLQIPLPEVSVFPLLNMDAYAAVEQFVQR